MDRIFVKVSFLASDTVQTITLDVDLQSDTIDKLKAMLFDKTGIEPDLQRVTFQGMRLRPGCRISGELPYTLQGYGMVEQSCLHLIVPATMAWQ